MGDDEHLSFKEKFTIAKFSAGATIVVALITALGGIVTGYLAHPKQEKIPSVEALREENARLRGRIGELEREIETYEQNKNAGTHHHTIGNLGLSDEFVETWIEQNGSKISTSELAIYLNMRGFHIYDTEMSRASAAGTTDNRVVSQDKIERALYWFTKANKMNSSHLFPIWNAACMNALLGNAGESVKNLEDLLEAGTSADQQRFRERICTDSDLCSILDSAPFKAYLSTLDCTGFQRQCPDPPLEVQ